MKLSQLIKFLQTEKRKRGDCSVYFSQDEEGNTYSDECFIGFYDDATIAIFPCGKKFTP